MNKEQCLEIIKLLSAIESWSFAKDRRLNAMPVRAVAVEGTVMQED